jgi:thiamine pyrophosphokinase
VQNNASFHIFKVNEVYQEIFIVSGGCSVDPVFLGQRIRKTKKSYMICCDKGAHHLKKLDMMPDAIIGDMDSIDQHTLKHFKKLDVKIIRYASEKDYTDTELALHYALELKPKKISIFCALGGRIDHTLANIYLLSKGFEKEIDTFLVDEYCEAFILNKQCSFSRETGKTVSLFALTPQVTGITLSGFYYPLENDVLKMGESRGISNRINQSRAGITIKKGKLLVIKFHQKDFFPEAR